MFKWTLLGFRWPHEVSQRQWWMKGVWRSALSPETVFRDLEPSQLLEWNRMSCPCTGTCVIHECWMGSANTWQDPNTSKYNAMHRNPSKSWNVPHTSWPRKKPNLPKLHLQKLLLGTAWNPAQASPGMCNTQKQGRNMICLQSVYLAKANRLSENFSRHLRAQLSQKVAARLGLLERRGNLW